MAQGFVSLPRSNLIRSQPMFVKCLVRHSFNHMLISFDYVPAFMSIQVLLRKMFGFDWFNYFFGQSYNNWVMGCKIGDTLNFCFMLAFSLPFHSMFEIKWFETEGYNCQNKYLQHRHEKRWSIEPDKVNCEDRRKVGEEAKGERETNVKLGVIL